MDFAGARSVSFTIEHPAEQLILRSVLAVLAFFVCAYLFFISSSVLNVIARQEALGKTARLQTGISAMEQDYFALAQTLTPQVGATLGLVPVQDPSYVKRLGDTALAQEAALQ